MYHIIKDLWHLHGTGQKGTTTETDRGQAFISRGGISSTVGNLVSFKVFKVLQSDFSGFGTYNNTQK